MKTEILTNDSFEFCLDRAVRVLKNKGVILYPTDTLYGLGADALSDEAVQKVYTIKGRDDKKPMHAIVADLSMAKRYAEVNDVVRTLAERFLPGPLTIILKKRLGVEIGIGTGRDTFAIRIPDNRFCLELARAFDGPFTTTSANISGAAPLRASSDIFLQLGDAGSGIEMVVDAGVLEVRLPSTVVDITHGIIEIVREGAIASRDIEALFNI